jgi:very-short-patch-repair endonuclease
MSTVKRHRRRAFLRTVVADAAGGSESLGELDVLAGVRRRGLPEPSRQSVRQLSTGRAYLDIEWDDWALVLEIDGAQHDHTAHRLADALRDLEVVASGQTVVRIPVVAWRLDEERVLDRLVSVFVARGWRPKAA